MNLANQFNPVAKPSHKRNKPTAHQRGLINQVTRKRLQQRSEGICERCSIGGVPLQAAHLIRRWRIEGRTTINELAHLCESCHRWADNTAVGRQWLTAFRKSILKA